MDALIAAHFFKCLRDILVLAMRKASVAVKQCHLTSEPAERLAQLQADVACPENNEMLRDMIELQRFNMRQRHRLQKSWNRLQRCACAGVDNHVPPAERTRATIV